MIGYPKIESLYMRDEKTHRFKLGDFRCPEFEYLYRNDWTATEKVDGINIRVGWDGESVKIAGRADRTQIPVFLLERLNDMFTPSRFGSMDPLTLYGEGYGARIQKGGVNYIEGGVDFVLFDVRCGDWWLQEIDVLDVAGKLNNIQKVPIRRIEGLDRIEEMVATGFDSHWGKFPAEGVVCKPAVEMNTRGGQRIIVKMKTKDFEGGECEKRR